MIYYTQSQKKRNILEVAFLFGEECIPVNLGLYMQISHDPRTHDPDPGPQEKAMKKSCVSFETECIFLLDVLFLAVG